MFLLLCMASVTAGLLLGPTDTCWVKSCTSAQLESSLTLRSKVHTVHIKCFAAAAAAMPGA